MSQSSRVFTQTEAEQSWLTLHAERRGLLSGLLLTMAFALVGLGTPGRFGILSWVAAVVTSLSGFLFPAYPKTARTLATLGFAGGLGLGYPVLRDAPTMTLATLIIVFGLCSAMVRHKGALERPWLLLTGPNAVRGAVIGALFTLFVAGLLRQSVGVIAGFVVVGIVFVLVLGWASFGARGDWLRRLAVVALTCLVMAYAYVLQPSPVVALTGLGGGLFLVMFLVRRLGADEESVWGVVLDHPARLVVTSFAALCLIGTVLLALPTSAEDKPLALVDAAFTAVSAVCVTGLSVVDTPTSFSFSGELFLALLIQLGGLGIMALYTTAFGLLGRRLSIRHEHAVASAQSVDQVSRLFRTLAILVGTTLAIESAGALLLFSRFVRYEAPDPALWRALFHAVSGFCNAGFGLQSDNLITYQTDPLVLHVIGLLIVLGGLSPAVVASLPLLWGKRHRITLQAKLALSTTALLLLVGFVLFLAFEWTNTLSHLTLADKLHNAWFQSITPRTAGFNSIDMTKISTPSRLLMIVLMFIGGCPGSTAGGIKTTTFALLTLAIIAALRGQSSVTAFGYRLPNVTVSRATAIATLGVGSVVFSTLALLLTQDQPFDVLLFEAVSALGTVGLTLGATPKLDAVGKVLIMTCMFAGRVGPLTVLLLLGGATPTNPSTLPEQDVQVS